MIRSEICKCAKPVYPDTKAVKAILNGRKTVMRTVLKNQDSNAYTVAMCEDEDDGSVDLICETANKTTYALYNKVPYIIGDFLYVRETWSIDNHNYLYRADFSDADLVKLKKIMRWAPSIHMPKEAARIFLRVTDVRVERLQDITGEGCIAEGVVVEIPPICKLSYNPTSIRYCANIM